MSSKPLGPVFLIGPQGCGKSEHAAQVAKMLGLARVVDDWNGRDPVPIDALVLSNCIASRADGSIVVEFGSTAHAILAGC